MAGFDVRLYATAALMTLLIFASIYSLNMFFESQREQYVTEQMNEIVDDFEEIETAYYFMDLVAQQNNSCDILKSELDYLESRLWVLDGRIKSYRDITKDFANDEFYIREKKKLNRREVIHLAMLSKLKKTCNYNHTIVLYFYGQCEQNRRCDEQGYVLTYINQNIDPEISILSFDADRNISAVDSLIKLYNVTEYPCVVVEGHTHCGLHTSDEMMALMCQYSPSLSICK